MDELIIVSDELKQKIKQAGADKLNQAQLAIRLGMPDQECRMLMLTHPELSRLMAEGEMELAVEQLHRLRDFARNPEDRNQFNATKLLYDILSNRQQGPSTVVVNNTVNHTNLDRNLKLIESLDADTIEAIVND